MEKTDKQSFMSLLVRDQESSSSNTKSPEGALNSMFSGAVNLQSILASTNPHTTQPLLPLSLFADNYSNLTTTPKSEQLYHQYGPVSAQSLNDYSSIFNHLPDLLSLDHSHSSASYKRARLLDSYPSYSPHNHHPQTLASYPLYPTPPTSPAAPPQPVVPRGSSLARKRRQTLSDKMRCLQKLLPWDHKMDTATMLEAAHGYIRFLQAQLTALQTMPIVASDSGSLPVLTRGGGDGDVDVDVLSRLSRAQLLQVLVNSPVAQMRMCSLGRCVFSVEQLALLNKRSVIRSAMLSGHYSPKLH